MSMHFEKRIRPAGPREYARRSASRVRRPRVGKVTTGRLVNDIHSQLNVTRVASIATPTSIEEVCEVVARARREGRSVCVAGGRHAMGGQQFATDGVLLDLSQMNRILELDTKRALVEVDAGIQWPELIAGLIELQRDSSRQLGIIQKQTGADRLSIGGALAANIHGRGLSLKPIIHDIESFVIVDGSGRAHRCSRDENSELFGLAIGGYGLFGIVTSVTLRLAPRQKLKRVVRIENLHALVPAFEQRITDGYLYGDFQFMTDGEAEGFLRRGVFSCYKPAAGEEQQVSDHKELSAEDWSQLLCLAHTDRRKAFDLYARHYLSTDGQTYWSDTHQLSVYLDEYHRELDSKLGAHRGSEMITEVYVSREKLVGFMETVRKDFRANAVELIYGTIRLIEKDDESFLPWAKDRFACVVFNLHVTHNAEGIEKARNDFRRLLDRAVEYGGSFYLTYHRWATREQLLACYPQFPDFLRKKREYDPSETFQSDWYRHHRALMSN